MMLPTSTSQYLRDHFVRSFVNDANPSNWDAGDDKGVFAITLLCLTYWNAAAGLAHGGRATATATTRFMSEKLGNAAAPFGPRYRDRASIVYALFRNGLVHQRFPGPVVGLTGNVTWVMGRDLPDHEHLALYGPLRVNEQKTAFGLALSGPVSAGGDSVLPPLSYIGLNPDLLYQHSLVEFERFATVCESDPVVSTAVLDGIRAAKTARRPNQEVQRMVDLALGASDPWP